MHGDFPSRRCHSPSLAAAAVNVYHTCEVSVRGSNKTTDERSCEKYVSLSLFMWLSQDEDDGDY